MLTSLLSVFTIPVMQKHAIIIGSGIGGLTAASYLRQAGFSVDVYESQSACGGKAQSLTAKGYRFDTGPSVFTMQDEFSHIFSELGESIQEHLSLLPLDPMFSYWWQDGSRADISPGAAGLHALGKQLGIARQSIEAYIQSCEKIYRTTHTLFLRHSLHNPQTYLHRDFWRALPGLPAIQAMKTMHDLNAGFFTDPRMQQFADRYATYNGSSPYLTPATMNIISYVENIQGAMTLKGGTYALPKALEAIARKKGVRFHYNTPVDSILFESSGRRTSRVVGVMAEGNKRAADIVVSNVDVETTYTKLLQAPDDPMLKKYLKHKPSSSVIVWYLGVGKQFSHLALNNIFFSRDYRTEFDQIFNRNQVPDDPTLYINITSKACPEDAPDYGENWFVLVNTPPHDGRNWEADAQLVYQRIIERMSRVLNCNIADYIEYAEVLTPLDIQTRTASRQGSIYGISSNTRTAAFARHPNRSKQYSGLYLCGGSTHPGGGMPMVSLSGRIAARLAIGDHA